MGVDHPEVQHLEAEELATSMQALQTKLEQLVSDAGAWTAENVAANLREANGEMTKVHGHAERAAHFLEALKDARKTQNAAAASDRR